MIFFQSRKRRQCPKLHCNGIENDTCNDDDHSDVDEVYGNDDFDNIDDDVHDGDVMMISMILITRLVAILMTILIAIFLSPKKGLRPKHWNSLWSVTAVINL